MREPMAHRCSLSRESRETYWTLKSICCRCEVCGRTSLGQRPRSTAAKACGDHPGCLEQKILEPAIAPWHKIFGPHSRTPAATPLAFCVKVAAL